MALCSKPYVGRNGDTGPCGQCLGCRINHKQLWTHRIILESKGHEQNSFITLTYNDENLPLNSKGVPTLVKRDLELFIKRLRDRVPQKLRYYAVGEYGTKGSRGINPHFHVCLFGADERYAEEIHSSWYKENGRGNHEEKISLGHTLTGTLTPQSAAYVAGYVHKKTKYNKDMYEEYDIVPEYSTMSQGIGRNAIKEIAKILEKYPEALTPTGDVPYSLQHGKRKLPLGNYLREKLREELGLDCTIQTLYDEKTGEIIKERKLWHAKETQKKIMQEEVRILRQNPEIQAQSGKLPEHAQISISKFLDWKNGQSIINFEKRHELYNRDRKTL
jgi:hypothetical protein